MITGLECIVCLNRIPKPLTKKLNISCRSLKALFDFSTVKPVSSTVATLSQTTPTGKCCFVFTFS